MKLKKIIPYIITFITGILIAIFFGYKRNEKQIEENNKAIDEAEKVDDKANSTIKDSKETIAKAKETIANAKKSNKDAIVKITTTEKTIDTIKSNIEKRNQEEKSIFGDTI